MKKLLLNIIPILILVSCSKSVDSNDNYEFYIDDNSKIAAEIIDQQLSIKFNPPKGWNFQSAELSKKIESRTKGIDPTQKNFSYKPVYLFFNDSTGSLMSIGLIDYPDSSMSLLNKLNQYKNLISNKYIKDQLVIGNFIKSKINFTQFKTEKENLVNYKIVFHNDVNGIVLFDCTMQKKNIASEHNYFKATVNTIENIIVK
ncbi:MAG: hypothetical protein FJ214_11290 [Ignavibacteria bacterium]|nr:hypothetical protein [Ignavibacteria bacterium]